MPKKMLLSRLGKSNFQLRRMAQLHLANTDPLLESPSMAFPPNLVPIGGVHIDSVRPLFSVRKNLLKNSKIPKKIPALERHNGLRGVGGHSVLLRHPYQHQWDAGTGWGYFQGYFGHFLHFGLIFCAKGEFTGVFRSIWFFGLRSK